VNTKYGINITCVLNNRYPPVHWLCFQHHGALCLGSLTIHCTNANVLLQCRREPRQSLSLCTPSLRVVKINPSELNTGHNSPSHLCRVCGHPLKTTDKRVGRKKIRQRC
jgi:hypothetical protein